MAQAHASTPYAMVIGASPLRLWHLTPSERLARQLKAAGLAPWQGTVASLPGDVSVVLLRGDFIYDARVLRGLAAAPGAVLFADDAGTKIVVGAHVPATRASAASDLLGTAGAAPEGLRSVTPEEVAPGFDDRLRKLDRPFATRIRDDNRVALERLTFAGAYRGVTDLVTKWLWPRPAMSVTRWCARLGITPNQVTTASLLLVVLAGVLFARGDFGWGLVAAWIMTFLDTVDGKLARVTVTSTRFGNVFDHGIDLIHPPLWYLAWAAGLALDPPAILGVPIEQLAWALVAGYVGGRLCEGAFERFVAPFSLFTWRPFDSWLRLVVARRNPSLIMLTASLLAGRPDLGFFAVTVWTVASTVLLAVRVLQAARARRRAGTLRSWLDEIGTSVDTGDLSVRVFTDLHRARAGT